MHPKKNPFLNQINDLTLKLLNDEIDGVDITRHAKDVAKREAMGFAREENRDLVVLTQDIEAYGRAQPCDMQGNFEEPGEVLRVIASMVSLYVEKRAAKLIKLKSDFDFSDAIHESAVKFHNGEKFH